MPREAKKAWDYKEITEKAENRIRSLLALTPISLKLRKEWAYGVFMGWESLTGGWQEVGDSARLEALLESVGVTVPPTSAPDA